ncbi:reticulon-4b isoform X3 [Labeo rohita]|uniref:reticulon-4b isoform X3 n=1 Tax=Labeo rohita TaxID=84645 RepID=UPI0021E1F102|nr:reticulon-4b isoform X3 [Labeo rohita]
MEEADKVSSSAPDGAPHDTAVNEAAAPADETLRNAENLLEKNKTTAQTTEVTSAPQMTEIPNAPRITEKTSTPQTIEITSAPQMTEETSTTQTTEITSAPQITEKMSTTQTTEITSAAQTIEITSTPQMTEETSTTQTTEINSAPQITEKMSTTQTTEITSTPQTTEITSAPQTTEITSAPQTTEITSAPQTTEITSAPQTTEITSIQQTTEETSASQIAEVTSTLQMTEIISTTQIPEETSTPQMTEETMTPQKPEEASAPQITEERVTTQIAEISSTSQITEETSSPEAAEESVTAPASEEPETPAEAKPVTPAAEEAPSSSVAAEASSSSSSSSSSVREESVTAVMESASAPQAPQEEEEAPHTEPESSTQIASEDREQEKEPHTLHPSPSHEPEPPAAPAVAPALLQFPSDRCDSPSVVSQVSASLAMDSSGGKDSAAFDPDVLSQSDDDFMFETKKSPFQAFSPVSDGLEEATAARRSVEVSESPSPDLVQDAYDEGHVQSEELRPETDADAPLSLSYAPSDLFSNVNAASDDRPTCLPDILKSSPLNPDKVDSGSSEGSPDFSPVHRSADDSPNSPFPAINPFGFDSKILLLKEMADETEARAVEKAKLEVENIDEQSFTAFDLVKETDVPLKSDGLPKDKDGAEELSQTSVQTADRFECLGFPGGNVREPSDSESPSADSFSPVLDAVPQETSSFGAEQERGAVGEELDAAEEVSEHEVSSEEFEFVERPPRGAAEEFLEMQDSLAFVKASEMPQDEDRSPKPEPQEAADQTAATEDAENQSSYHLLTQASDKPSKAGLESDFQEISPAPVIHPPVDETGAEKTEAEVVTCDLSAAAVLELLYWRDVKSSGLVFGSSLFLLLSLLTCSIVSVLSYSALALLSVTISFRIYRGVLQAIQKSDEGHPFKRYLDQEVTLSKDAVQRHSDVVLSCVNCTMKELRHLFLVEDLVDSLKFAVFLWVLTYVGAWFNGLTLLILGLIGAFSGPVVYEKHQTQIDQFISTLKNRMKEVMGQIQAKVPGAKKKSE